MESDVEMCYEIIADTKSGRKRIVETTAFKTMVSLDEIGGPASNIVIERNGTPINVETLEDYANHGDGCD